MCQENMRSGRKKENVMTYEERIPFFLGGGGSKEERCLRCALTGQRSFVISFNVFLGF